MRALLFHCIHCGSGSMTETCNRPLCREKEAQRQTVLKCAELGIPFRPEPVQLPLRLGDP